MKHLLTLLLPILSISCTSQEVKPSEPEKKKTIQETIPDEQIGEYIVETFQDSKENLWFGTIDEGVAKFDGEKLTYFTTKDGLASNRVINVIEDQDGNLWFGTGAGISKYDGKTFTNYSKKDGLCNEGISLLFFDKKNMLWIGSWEGVCRFDGKTFEYFDLPYPKVETLINEDTKNWITSIKEDSKGNIWIGRDGYGACKFDGKTFVHYTTKDGLNSNNVQSIVEDKEGNIWIGTRVAERDLPDESKRFGKGGLNKFDGKTFTHFPDLDGLHDADVYGIYKDRSNNLWISTVKNGIYKYENNQFKNFPLEKASMGFVEDKSGKIWIGCAGGLYRLDSTQVINITKNGPWK